MQNQDEIEHNEPPVELGGSGGTPASTKTALTFDKAIEMGEYHPEFLAQFPEWHGYPRYIQFEFIRKALTNRRKQLLTQWMEINKSNDYSKKPHLIEASKNVEHQLSQLRQDKEALYTEYSE